MDKVPMFAPIAGKIKQIILERNAYHRTLVQINLNSKNSPKGPRKLCVIEEVPYFKAE